MRALAWVLRGGLGLSVAGFALCFSASKANKYAAPVDLVVSVVIPGAVGFVGLGIDFVALGVVDYKKPLYLASVATVLGSGTWWYLRRDKPESAVHPAVFCGLFGLVFGIAQGWRHFL